MTLYCVEKEKERGGVREHIYSLPPLVLNSILSRDPIFLGGKNTEISSSFDNKEKWEAPFWPTTVVKPQKRDRFSKCERGPSFKKLQDSRVFRLPSSVGGLHR